MRKLKLEDETKVLFNNGLLERISRTHVGIPIFLFLSISMMFSAYAFVTEGYSIAAFGALFLAGLVFFTLVEYCIHRFIYHIDEGTYEPDSWKYIMHGVHHDYPKDKDRLAMPPILALLTASVFFFIFRSVLIQEVYAFYPGFIFGYALYLIVHYAVHTCRPPGNFLRYLWKHHSLHHYKYPDKAFGVTSALWDYVFNTMPPQTAPELSNKELRKASKEKGL